MMLNKLLILAGLIFNSIFLVAQSPPILITDADFDAASPMDCNLYALDPGTPTNFFDSGGSGGNYSDNENEVITICPDLTLGSKVTASFAIGSGMTWSVDPTDTLYVFDGNSVGAPLIGKFNSGSHPTGFIAVASWANPSGCLTLQFISDGAINATGWDAGISCGNLPQPFEPHMESYINGDLLGGNDMMPADTGYTDVCLGDSIMFVAAPIFPYDVSLTGTGYDQISGYTVEWDFSDGSSATGDTAWFTPPSRAGFLVQMKITDPILVAEQIISKARVSTVPSFASCVAIPDTICLGATANLVGGVTATDTAGVDGTTASFQLGGSFAGLTFLPDGSGVSHTDTLTMTGFGTTTIGAATDLTSICINIEHSYIGDLDITLTCPNGTTVILMDCYSGAGPGNTFLGDALDDGTLTPGVGMDYCWTMVSPTYSDMTTENIAGTYIPATVSPPNNILTPGDYSPLGDFNDFAVAGCPVDGDWIITITDNIGADNGYLFEWGLFFDPSLNPYSEYYTPLIFGEQWVSDPTIVAGTGDTAIVIQPTVAGDNSYTFQVMDNFGCVYDTTIIVNVLNGPELLPGDTACNNTFQVIGTYAPEGGLWSYTGPGTVSYFPNTTFINPTLDVDVPGLYTFTFTDNQCGLGTDLEVLYIPDVTASLEDYFFCEGESRALDVTDVGDPTVSYLWSTGSTDPEIEVSVAGNFSVEVTGFCNSANAASEITTDPCLVIVPNVISIGSGSNGHNDYFTLDGLHRWPNTQLSVLNRWGQIVYHSDNYMNDWDGRNGNNGQLLPAGTYFYIVVYNNGDSETGHVTLFED
ncbi:MAG: T9SS type B sorting domain-containing protein [Crocinitomicaceae bacterium]|nr:T9SS type B sorting domain-containing protein [Crocinitomicaceae bacterium]